MAIDIPSPRAFGLEWKPNDPDLVGLLEALSETSDLDTALQEYKLSIDFLLDIYKGAELGDNVGEIKDNFSDFIETESITINCGDSSTVALREIIDDPMKFSSTLYREIRKMHDRIIDRLEGYQKSSYLILGIGPRKKPTIAQLAAKQFIDREKDKVPLQKPETSPQIVQEIQIKGDKYGLNQQIQKLEFSKEYLDLSSLENFKTSLFILPLHMFGGFVTYFQSEIVDGNNTVPSELDEKLSKFLYKNTVSKFVGIVDEYCDLMFENCKQFMPADHRFSPFISQEKLVALRENNKYAGELLDTSTMEGYLASLALIDHTTAKEYVDSLKQLPKGWGRHVCSFRGIEDNTLRVQLFRIKGNDGFKDQKGWMTFVANWGSAIYQYCVEKRIFEQQGESKV